MKTKGTGIFRSIVGKIMAGLALAALIGSVDAAPVMARDNVNRGGAHQGNRHYESRGRGHGYDRGHGHDRGYYRGGRWYPSFGYVEPVYVAPPVYYAPEPAPGVSIFLPAIHIR
jgi:hypothetical protein